MLGRSNEVSAVKFQSSTTVSLDILDSHRDNSFPARKYIFVGYLPGMLLGCKEGSLHKNKETQYALIDTTLQFLINVAT